MRLESLEKLPDLLISFDNRLKDIEGLLVEFAGRKESESEDVFLNVQEAAKLLHLSVNTLYCKVSKNQLPYYKRSKRLLFKSKELTDYLTEGRKRTTSQLESDAKEYIENSSNG